MDEQKKYNPKYGREEEFWDQDSWQTGSTKPPKDKGGLLAVMLILVIFLCGIVTVLGILNVKLFTQLKVQEEAQNSISFTPEETQAAVIPETIVTEPVAACAEEDVSICLQESPESPENVRQQEGLSLQEIYEKNIASVVSIACQSRSGSSAGTGVIVSGQGYIVTNSHVIDNAESITVLLADGRTLQAGLVGADEISDLAVLYVEADALIAAEFGDSGALRVGDSVAAIGDPLGVKFRGSFTDGIVSAINRDISVNGRTMSLIQTNAALNSGNSGGPLINCYGQVIGINTMKIGAFTDAAGVEGIGFAIPSITVKDIVDQIIAQGYVSGRPTLGIEGEALSAFYQHYYRLPAGLYITYVVPGSDAYEKGIEDGDMLLSINNQRVTTMEELKSILFDCEVGETVEVIIYRSGERYRLPLTLGENKG